MMQFSRKKLWQNIFGTWMKIVVWDGELRRITKQNPDGVLSEDFGRSLKHLTFIEGISGSCSDPERHPLEVLEELQLALQFESRVIPMVTKRQMAK